MNETAWVREERPAFKQEAPDVARVRKLMLEAERIHSEICEEFKRRYLAIVNENYCEIAWEVAEGKPVTQTPELIGTKMQEFVVLSLRQIQEGLKIRISMLSPDMAAYFNKDVIKIHDLIKSLEEYKDEE